MSDTTNLDGYRALLDALATAISDEHREKVAVDMLTATASAIARRGGLSPEQLREIYNEQLTRYEESSASKLAGFPIGALVAGQRSLN